MLDWIGGGGHALTLDLLTYAGNRANLARLDENPRHQFVHGAIRDSELAGSLLAKYRPAMRLPSSLRWNNPGATAQ